MSSSQKSAIIPGLTPQVYVAGSRHSASTPTLSRAIISEKNVVDFQWTAFGSSQYTVSANGCVKTTGFDSNTGLPLFDNTSLKVKCTCPDGVRQLEVSMKCKQMYVCKHTKAALDSVLDRDAMEVYQQERQEKAEEAKRLAAEKIQFLKDQHAAQESKYPGERERIEHGLSKKSDEDIVSLLKTKTATVEGLEALIKLFPVDVIPPKMTKRCGRCNIEYDPNIQSDLICREEHPYELCTTMWDGSKKSWRHCGRCDKDFGLDGFPSWSKRKRGDPNDEGRYCYQSTHVSEDEYNEADDPVIDALNEDDGDY